MTDGQAETFDTQRSPEFEQALVAWLLEEEEEALGDAGRSPDSL